MNKDDYEVLTDEQVGEVLALCLKVNSTTKSDVFFNYSPHIDMPVSFNVHVNGYRRNNDCDYRVDVGGYGPLMEGEETGSFRNLKFEAAIALLNSYLEQ